MPDKTIRIPGIIPHGIIRYCEGDKLFVGLSIPRTSIRVDTKFMSECREVFDAALRSGIAHELTTSKLPGEDAPPPKAIQ